MASILNVDQIILEAQNAYQHGKFEDARRLFGAAQESFVTQGDDLRAAEMANNLCVVYLQLSQAQLALDVVAPTIPVFQNSGNQKMLAVSYGNWAAALAATGNQQAALTQYQQAADLLRQLGEDDLYAHTMQALSALQLKSGNSLEALATMRSGVDHLQNPKLQHRILRKILDWPFRILNRS